LKCAPPQDYERIAAQVGKGDYISMNKALQTYEKGPACTHMKIARNTNEKSPTNI